VSDPSAGPSGGPGRGPGLGRAAALIALALVFGLVAFAGDRAGLFARAAAQGDPDLLQVTGVEGWDVLYIRAEPRAGAVILAAIPPDGRGVERLPAGEAGRPGWLRVRYHGTEGWASGRYLEPEAPWTGGGALPATLTCFGTEPFWDLTLGAEAAVFEQLGVAAPRRLVRRVTDRAWNRTDRWAIEFAGAGAGQGVAAVQTIGWTGQCSDGMSDTLYPFETVLRFIGGETLAGCCRQAD
jgi:uncharacterized membrane protein